MTWLVGMRDQALEPPQAAVMLRWWSRGGGGSGPPLCSSVIDDTALFSWSGGRKEGEVEEEGEEGWGVVDGPVKV